jgi:hypothetical protein
MNDANKLACVWMGRLPARARKHDGLVL